MILKLKFRQDLACVLRHICVQLPPEFLTRGSAPGPRWGHRPKTPIAAMSPFASVYSHGFVTTSAPRQNYQEPKAHNPRMHNIGSQILY